MESRLPAPVSFRSVDPFALKRICYSEAPPEECDFGLGGLRLYDQLLYSVLLGEAYGHRHARTLEGERLHPIAVAFSEWVGMGIAEVIENARYLDVAFDVDPRGYLYDFDPWLIMKEGQPAIGEAGLVGYVVLPPSEEPRFRRIPLEGTLGSAEGGEDGEWFRTGPHALKERIPPPDILGLVTEGTFALLYGLPKEAGKSRLGRSSIHAVIQGAEFLGRLCRKATTVLNTEEPRKKVLRRLQKEGIDRIPGLSVRFQLEHPDETWDETLAAVRRKSEDTEAKLVIFDTLGACVNLKDHRAVKRALASLRAWTNEGIAVIVVMQETKAGGSLTRGAHAPIEWLEMFDDVIHLAPDAGAPFGSHRRILERGGRDDEEDGALPSCLHIELVDGSFEVREGGSQPGTGRRRTRAADRARPMILAVLRDAPAEGLTNREILARIRELYEDAPGRTSIAEARDELIQEGAVVVLAEGAGKRGARFALA